KKIVPTKSTNHPTQKDIKLAYSLVADDLFDSFRQMEIGQSVKLGVLGVFTKSQRKYDLVGLDGKRRTGSRYKFNFRLFPNNNHEVQVSKEEPIFTINPALIPLVSHFMSLLPSIIEPIIGQKIPPVIAGGAAAEFEKILRANGDDLRKALDFLNKLGDGLLKIEDRVGKIEEVLNNSSQQQGIINERLTGLDNKFQNVRLTHEHRETKSLEYKEPPRHLLRQELNKINASSQLLPKLVEEMAKTNNFLAEFGKAIQE
ncbi:11670_t:CDS:2, partial [Racocetra fulgida]